MTEQEARTKCCPIHGRGTQSDGNWMFPCIASDCMKWPECKFWWERPSMEQMKADYDAQARKTAQIIVAEFETKHGEH